MDHAIVTGIIIVVPLLIQLLGLVFAVGADPYISKRDGKLMLMIAAIIFSLIIQNCLIYYFGRVQMPFGKTLASIYGYSVRPLIILLFMKLVDKKDRFIPAWIMIGINAAVYFTAIFSGISFSYSAAGSFQRGPLSYTCHIISAVLLAWLLFISIKDYGFGKNVNSMIPVGCAAVIVASVLADMYGFDVLQVSCLTIAVTISSVFYYIWLHLQFVREHEQALMAEQRIKIMISQIQPHFLYNTLATIQALCRIDPEQAFSTTEKFGQYLRQNLDSLNRSDLVSFEKELEHTKVYADIEKIRFPSINVEYDIEDDDFSLPALTIQPLVENAIRHGVRAKKDGYVKVITHKLPGCHEVIIKDNGKGFDVEAAFKADETHIGLRNVKERVEKMCGGTMTIESEIGVGTEIGIAIPDVPET